MSTPWRKYQVPGLPTGKSGAWRIERFELTQEMARRSREEAREDPLVVIGQGDPRSIMIGEHTRLKQGGDVIMSDTRAEIFDHLPFIKQARGRVLIHGLGIGLVSRAVAMKKAVGSVTVVEKSEDVIKLVKPWLMKQSDKIEIIHGDAFEWEPNGNRWEYAWHDIWGTINDLNLAQMDALMTRFGPYVETYQGCWSEPECVAFAEVLEAVRRATKRVEPGAGYSSKVHLARTCLREVREEGWDALAYARENQENES